MRSLDLAVLGSRYVVRLPDETWLEFVESMWAPFVSGAPGGDGDSVFEIHGDPDWGWKLTEDGEPQFAGSDRWKIASELRYWIVYRALTAATGFAFVHAAVLARGDDGVLLVGRSGGGKTTLSLGLAEHGWAYLSDDLAAVDRTDHTIEPVPVPAGIKDPARWEELRRLWGAHDAPVPEGEFLVPVAGLAASSRRRVRPAFIFFIEFERSAPAAAEPLSVAQAVTLLAEHAVGLTPSDLADYVAICRGARSARLRYGSTEAAIDAADAYCRT